jgi:hypothetical protein
MLAVPWPACRSITAHGRAGKMSQRPLGAAAEAGKTAFGLIPVKLQMRIVRDNIGERYFGQTMHPRFSRLSGAHR